MSLFIAISFVKACDLLIVFMLKINTDSVDLKLKSYQFKHHLESRLLPFHLSTASNIVLMSDKAVLVDFGLTVQMTDDVYIPRDLRGTEVRK